MGTLTMVSTTCAYSRLPDGKLLVTTLPGGSFRVDGVAAGPRLLISTELLNTIADGGGLNAELETACCRAGHGYVGAVLKINGVNRQVIYRITDMAPRIDGYIGEWPD